MSSENANKDSSVEPEPDFVDCLNELPKLEPQPQQERKIERYNDRYLTWRQLSKDEARLKYYIKNNLISQNSERSNPSNFHSNSVETVVTMSGQSTPVFNATDPELQGLTPAQLAYLNQKVIDQLNANPGHTRVMNVNTRIDPPSYNPDSQTSASFFTKCEKYFRSQGYNDTQFHNMAQTIVKGNMRLWYDGIIDKIANWEDFKREFAARFDNSAVQEKRRSLLYTRKQKYHESCEQFIQEMVNLAKQVDPAEDEKKSVERAYNALIPDIRRATGALSNLTVNSLLEILASTYQTIQSSDRLHYTQTKLPPLYGYSVAQGPQIQQTSGRGRGIGDGRGSWFRPRSNSFPSQFFRQPPHNRMQQQNTQIQQPSSSQYVQRTQIPTFVNNVNQSASNTLNTPNNWQSQPSQNSNFRQRSNSIPNNTGFRSAFDKSNIRCHKCNNLGHFAKECTTQPISMAIPANTHEQQYSDYDYQQPSTSTASLNSQGRVPQSFGRGSSQ